MKKRKSCDHRCPDSVYFRTLLLIIYFRATKRLICRREMSLIGSTSFSFAQNTTHDFQNSILNSQWNCLRQMPQKLQHLSQSEVVVCNCFEICHLELGESI